MIRTCRPMKIFGSCARRVEKREEEPMFSCRQTGPEIQGTPFPRHPPPPQPLLYAQCLGIYIGKTSSWVLVGAMTFKGNQQVKRSIRFASLKKGCLVGCSGGGFPFTTLIQTQTSTTSPNHQQGVTQTTS